jgi:hypothetical protein
MIARLHYHFGGGVTSVAPPSVPFTSDADTYWWDFSSSPNITTNTVGTETIAVVNERVGGKAALVQTLKDQQAIRAANPSHGAAFNQATRRQMHHQRKNGVLCGV